LIVTGATLALLLAAAQPPVSPEATALPPPGPSAPLMAYAGEFVSVRYAPGALDRALHVTRRLDLVVGELSKWLDMPLPLTAMVLDRVQWDRMGLTRPYGLPLPMSIGSVAVPGAGDDGTVRRWKTWIGTELPRLDGVPLVGTSEEASSLLLADVILQVEVCEQLLGRTPLLHAEPWIRGLTSHLAALSLWSDFEPGRATELALIFRRLRETIPPLFALEEQRLAHGEPPMATERWLLAEGHLFEGATLAHAAGGTKTWKRLLKAMRKSKEPPTRAQVLEVYPAVGPWLESLPAGSGVL
jgi:hypothetical protein